jgi:HAD superfamily phosphoserine phosphatase-like hydrolase
VSTLTTNDEDNEPRLGPCPDGITEVAWRRIAEAIRAEEQPLAVFDADGTLWADDLGETHIHVLAERRFVEPGAGHKSLLSEYASRCEADVDDGYAWGARILGDMPEARVVESAIEAWARHRDRLLEPVAAVVRALLTAGVDVAVVSASNRWVVEAAVEELGIGPKRVIAVDLERDGATLTRTVVQPMPNGPGKVGAIDVHLGRRPTLAFGNSVHDVPMLRSAALGVCVLATTAEQPELSEVLEVIRAEAGWLYLGVPHPKA